MALPLTNSAEGGSDETTVTTGNSGGTSGNAWDVVTTSTGSIVYDNARAAHGAFSYRFTNGSPATVMGVRWSTSIGSFTEIWGRLYCYFTAIPTLGNQLVRINQSDSTRLATILPGVAADKKLYVATNLAGGQSSGSIDIAVNQWVRIEFHFIANASTGMIEAKLFNNADSATVTETVTRSGFNTGSAGAHVDFGYGVSANAGEIIWLDDLQVNGTGYPGPAQQTLLPDADTATGGWTTAPLFSKVNDSSDATIITATAS